MKIILLPIFFVIFLLNFQSSAIALTFNQYYELSECVDTYRTFRQYKKNLQKCYNQKNLNIEDDSIKLIEKKDNILRDIIDFDIPEEIKPKKTKKKLSDLFNDIKESINKETQDVFDQKTVFSKDYNTEIKISLEDENFSKLNDYIKKNPKDIYAITEDINNLTYQDGLISEIKRQEILLNVYNSFDYILLQPLPGLENAITASTSSMGIAGIAIAAAAGGGGGGGGSSSPPPTISFAVSSTSVGECDANVTVTANLTGAHSSNVTVNWAVGGTATINTDYTLTSTAQTIVAGATSGTITLDPTNDTTVETSETVTLAASVTGVSTTGNTSTTITLHDYVLKCNATAFSEGTTSEQNTIKNRSTGTAIEAGGKVHPYEQMGIHKVQSFKSNGVSLTGVGETIHIADFNCDDNHDIYNNKTITNLDDGDAGESTFGAATASDNHCQGVAMFAAGDVGARTGVAPDADLVLSSIPNTSGFSSDDFAVDLDAARAAGAIASNQSWGMGGTTNNATEVETFRVNNGLTQRQAFATLRHGSASSSSLAAWDQYIASLVNYQSTGVMVWANANDTTESDISAMAALPFWYDGTKHSSDLTKAWLTTNVTEYTGDADLSNAVESEFTLQGNKCGTMKEYCLTVDGWDTFNATFVSGGVSQYSTGRISYGSSWSAPMVSGGVALMAQAFPNHTPEQLVDRILASANNVFFTPQGNTTFTTHGASIRHGYHDSWGHGVPDFYAAMSPITSDSNPLSFGFATPSGSGGSGGSGGSVPFSQVQKLAVSQTAMTISSSLGDGIMNGLKDKTAYAYDALNGGFKYNVTDFVSVDSLNTQQVQYTIDDELNNLRNFKFSEDKNIKNFKIYAGEYLSFRNKYNEGLSVTLDQTNIALQNFNLYNTQQYKNPFTTENKGVGFNNKFDFLGSSVLLGYNNSKFNPLTNINKDVIVPLETVALSVNLDNDNFDLLSFTTGLLKEENTFLLSEGSGAFNLSDEGNLTNFYGFNFSKSLSNLGNIYFSSMFGNSKLENSQNSLIVDTSNVLSSSFEINYELKNLFEKNQLNISLSQPNRVEQGDMTFRFMGLADKNGILPYEDHKVSLSPSGRQKDLTISYYTNHSNNFKTGIKAILTDDLGHVKNSNLSTNLLISTSLSF